MANGFFNRATLLSLAVAALLVSSAFFIPMAEAQYNPTRGIASSQSIGCSGPDCQACHLVTLANNIITFLIYAGAIVAALLFTYVGIKMIVSGDDSHALSEATSVFTGVVIGFLIMLSAWLIVDTALKALLSPAAWEFGPWNKVLCPEAGPGTIYQTPIQPPTGRSSEECTRKALEGKIGINKAACPDGARFQNVPGGCTSVGGLPKQALEQLIHFKNNCTGCGPISITGGSEAGHGTHGVGRPIIDISYSGGTLLYLQQNSTRSRNSRGEDVYTIGGVTFTHETNPAHFHVVFPVSSREPYTCPQ